MLLWSLEVWLHTSLYNCMNWEGGCGNLQCTKIYPVFTAGSKVRFIAYNYQSANQFCLQSDNKL